MWPSDIGNQYYCEFKVHLECSHPEVETHFGAMEIGEAGHEGLEAIATPITQQQIEEAIHDGQSLAVAEWTLGAIINGVPIRGRPDLVSMAGKDVESILEFKFSSAATPFFNQAVQVATYGLLAERMGLGIKDMVLGIVLLRPAGFVGNLKEFGEQKAILMELMEQEGVLHDIIGKCAEARNEMLARGLTMSDVEGDGWTAYLARHDSRKALGWVEDKLRYWRSEREPLPELKMANKCRACPFNAADLCKHALATASGFEVTRIDGRIEVTRAWRV